MREHNFHLYRAGVAPSPFQACALSGDAKMLDSLSMSCRNLSSLRKLFRRHDIVDLALIWPFLLFFFLLEPKVMMVVDVVAAGSVSLAVSAGKALPGRRCPKHNARIHSSISFHSRKNSSWRDTSFRTLHGTSGKTWPCTHTWGNSLLYTWLINLFPSALKHRQYYMNCFGSLAVPLDTTWGYSHCFLDFLFDSRGLPCSKSY